MLVVEKDFTQQVGPTLLSFVAGTVVEDAGLEEQLTRTKAPVLPVEDKDDLIICPHCRKLFTIQQAVGEEDC